MAIIGEVGIAQLKHVGEELCGDTVKIIRNPDETVIVLSDGLGSGVKANILSSLTAQICSKMIAADVIVMATPVYFYTMSAQMKTLIDRCCGRYTEISNKEFYILLTAAEDDRKRMLRTVDTFQGFFDCLDRPTLRGVVYGLGVWHVGEIQGHPALQEAYRMGRNL